MTVISDAKRVLILANEMGQQVGSKQAIVSGAINVWLEDARMPDRELAIISPDNEGFQIGSTPVIPIDPGVHCMDPVLSRRFHGSGGWQLMFAPAYGPHYPAGVRDAMFEAAGVPLSMDITGDLHKFIRAAQPARLIEDQFLERYRRSLEELSPGTIAHIEGYKTLGIMAKYGAMLRNKGVRTIVRIHEAWDDRLGESNWGKEMLAGLSTAEQIYFHTDHLARHARTAFEKLSLPAPTVIGRYDLGINRARVEMATDIVHDWFNNGNRTSAEPFLASLSEEQHRFVNELKDTYGRIPFRWMCIDSLDPTKGGYQMLSAIDRFLELERSRCGSTEKLKERHRFFLVQSGRFPSEQIDPTNMNIAYGRFVLNLRNHLQQKWSGIIHVCDAFRGEAAAILPGLALGSQPINFSSSEGLNLAHQEMLYANTLSPSAPIAGVLSDGTGFAQQALENGTINREHIGTAGNADSFTLALSQATESVEMKPKITRDSLKRFVTREVLSRRSSIFDYK